MCEPALCLGDRRVPCSVVFGLGTAAFSVMIAVAMNAQPDANNNPLFMVSSFCWMNDEFGGSLVTPGHSRAGLETSLFPDLLARGADGFPHRGQAGTHIHQNFCKWHSSPIRCAATARPLGQTSRHRRNGTTVVTRTGLWTPYASRATSQFVAAGGPDRVIRSGRLR